MLKTEETLDGAGKQQVIAEKNSENNAEVNDSLSNCSITHKITLIGTLSTASERHNKEDGVLSRSLQETHGNST